MFPGFDEPKLQDLIVEIRAANGLAGWTCPESLRIYQAIAREVQRPLEWRALSEQTKQSLDEYLQLCRETGMEGAQLSIQRVDLIAAVESVKTDSATDTTLEPQSIAIANAVNKITDPSIKEALLQYNKSRRMMGMRGEGSTLKQCYGRGSRDLPWLRKCSKCLVREYCCVQCQKWHWAKAHKKECALFVEIVQIRVPDALGAKLDALNAAVAQGSM